MSVFGFKMPFGASTDPQEQIKELEQKVDDAKKALAEAEAALKAKRDELAQASMAQVTTGGRRRSRTRRSRTGRKSNRS